MLSFNPTSGYGVITSSSDTDTMLWQSLALGRPMSVYRQSFDTEFPRDSTESLGVTPYCTSLNLLQSFTPILTLSCSSIVQNFKYSFCEQCLIPLIDQALSATQPTYAKVLQLDSMVRNWGPPQADLMTVKFDFPPAVTCLARGILLSSKEICGSFLCAPATTSSHRALGAK